MRCWPAEMGKGQRVAGSCCRSRQNAGCRRRASPRRCGIRYCCTGRPMALYSAFVELICWDVRDGRGQVSVGYVRSVGDGHVWCYATVVFGRDTGFSIFGLDT